jgi:hypothetical protein
MLHFVGFRGEEYVSAVKVFGKPDFYHKVFDRRSQEDFDPKIDTMVFAKGSEDKFTEFTFDWSRVF